MAIFWPKRIKHLARYFGIFALVCLLGYGAGLGRLFLIFLGPPLMFVYWLRVHANFLVMFIPHEPFFNNLFLFLPVTIIYFGLVGFQLKNIINERGKVRLLILVAFVAFIVFIHYLAYHEISLYWAGSQKFSPPTLLL